MAEISLTFMVIVTMDVKDFLLAKIGIAFYVSIALHLSLGM